MNANVVVELPSSARVVKDLTDNGVVVGDADSGASSTAAGTNGQLLIGQTGGPPEFKTVSGDVSIDEDGVATVTGAAVTPASLTGTDVAVVAAANVIGGIPVVHEINVPDGATGDVDVVLTHKTRVLDVQVIKTAGAGGASDTITVKNGATAITDAMDINVADGVVVRPATIDDASYEIAAAGTLRVTRTKASGNNVACRVIVTGVRTA